MIQEGIFFKNCGDAIIMTILDYYDIILSLFQESGNYGVTKTESALVQGIFPSFSSDFPIQ
jgi:hypothetical protein